MDVFNSPTKDKTIQRGRWSLRGLTGRPCRRLVRWMRGLNGRILGRNGCFTTVPCRGGDGWGSGMVAAKRTLTTSGGD